MSPDPAQSTEIRTARLRGLPTDLDKATQVLQNLGYKHARAWAVEPDRIAASAPDTPKGFTLTFRFDHDAGKVHITRVEGWPID